MYLESERENGAWKVGILAAVGAGERKRENLGV